MLGWLTECEFSCEHPPVWLGEARMRDGRRELAGYDARVFVSWNEVLGGRARSFRVARHVAPVPDRISSGSV